jgi:hypothetical protein
MAFCIGSTRLSRRRRQLTITSDRTVSVGMVRQGFKVTPVTWDGGVGMAVVRPGPCDVHLYYEDGDHYVECLKRHKRTWPKLGHRAPKMPHRYAEYTPEN